MAKRQSKKELVPPPIGISGDEQKLFIKLETEYREAVGLARVEALLETDRGFCLISCFQAGRSFRDNLRTFLQMPKAMQTLTGRPELGGFWLIAHWVEAAGTVEGTDQNAVCWRHSLEYSWLFVQPPHFEDRRWLTAATLMAQAHGQDFFVLRTTGTRVAGLYDARGEHRRSISEIDAILPTAKAVTYLRSRGETWGQGDFETFVDAAARPTTDRGNSFGVHQDERGMASAGPKPVTLYAAKPHCNSSSWVFSALNVWQGG